MTDTCLPGSCTCCTAPEPGWTRAARQARTLAVFSLAWMSAEAAVGIAAGITAGSVALTGWALSSLVEAAASVIVIWRFTGTRTHSEHAERRAQRAIAVSFWLLAPYIAAEAVHDLAAGEHAATSALGITVTAASLLVMPGLGLAKRRLGDRLHSAATAGDGGQNLLCAYLAAAVLAGLTANAVLGWWWLDPIIALAVAALAVREGRHAWNGDDCC